MWTSEQVLNGVPEDLDSLRFMIILADRKTGQPADQIIIPLKMQR